MLGYRTEVGEKVYWKKKKKQHRSEGQEAEPQEELEYLMLLVAGQHTSWVGKSLLVSMGYAGELEQHHNQEMKEEVFFEAKDDDIPAWFEHKATEDSDDTNDSNETT